MYNIYINIFKNNKNKYLNNNIGNILNENIQFI